MARFGERKGNQPEPGPRDTLRARLATLALDPDAPPIAPLLSLGLIDRAKPPGPRLPPLAAALEAPGVLASTDLSEKLESLTALALERATDILENAVDPDSDYYPEELRAQTSTIKTALQTQVRVDEQRLRQKLSNALPNLLAILKEEELRLGQNAA